ncbi:MAG: phosphoenolpyruvate carboxykinase (ATP) [Trueperaceae bacterium]|nr:phosphoenolpyruvate carboxykinase (ATP) [Trueperaceae bacterium]
MTDSLYDTASTLRLPLIDPVTNASTAVLYEHAVRLGEARIAEGGPLVVDTGKFTGRSPRDKFVVRDALTEHEVDWGPVNQPMSPEHFGRLQDEMFDAAAERRLFVQELFAGTDPSVQIPVRVVSERAWHSLFVRNLFVHAGTRRAGDGWTVLDLPTFKADPDRHETRSSTAIAVDYTKRLVLIANSEYAGEIKKSIFGVLNFTLPRAGVLPMHCSANVGAAGDVALFFGLSGTGKTTLSADPQRTLVGDDEHGWSDTGIFNFEGGCYAKAIRLTAAAEPEIHAASTRFGTVLENVVLDPVTRAIDFDDARKTENTRAAYPLAYIPNASTTGRADHPASVVFLTADAFGVLPPIARLDAAQAMYHFLSGYTAKVAGTERGVDEPQATFSACFGSPFMPLAPGRYAEMLGERLRRHGATVWLVNTGWTGGPAGVGHRMRLGHTRAMVDAALSGRLDGVPMRRDPVFGLEVPTAIPGIPHELLDPRSTWADPGAFDVQCDRLAQMFHENFARFAAQVADEVVRAGPRA